MVMGYLKCCWASTLAFGACLLHSFGCSPSSNGGTHSSTGGSGGGGTVAVVSHPVAAGNNHSCALSGGHIRCWGDNYYGQLGDGTTNPSLTPVSVTGIRDAVAVLRR